MVSPGINPSRINEITKVAVNTAGLNDYSLRRGEDAPSLLTCSVEGRTIEIKFLHEKFAGDPIKIQRIVVQHQAYREELLPDEATAEAIAQSVGATIYSRFQELSSAAASKGLDVLRATFDRPDTIQHQAHLVDVKREITGNGTRKVTAQLIVEDVVLKPSKPTKLRLNVPGQDDPAIEVDRTELVVPKQGVAPRETLSLQLTIQEEAGVGDESTLWELVCETASKKNYRMVSSTGTAGKILLLSIFNKPDLVEHQAIPLTDLAHNIRQSFDSSPLEEQLRTVVKQIQKTLLFHLTDEKPIDRSQLAEGDLIAHIKPGDNPGLRCQIYRVKELQHASEENADRDRISMRIISAEGTEAINQIPVPQSERFTRMILNTELPSGQQGLLNLVFDHNFELALPCIRRWKELSDMRWQLLIHANRDADLNHHVASYQNGLFTWEIKILDPLMLALINGLSDQAAAVKLPEDQRNHRFDYQKTEAILERRIEGAPSGTFSAPGYWRLTPHLEKLLVQFEATLGKLTEIDVLTLALKELSFEAKG